VSEKSRAAILESLVQNHLQGDGNFGKLASEQISILSGGGHVLLTPSCTHALEMASMLCEIEPGDEVIIPSFTFTSGATSITQFGGTPVFVDISPDSGCIDVSLIEGAITSRTKAISWVNYAGNVPDLEELGRISKKYNLILIEDNAHGFGGVYKGQNLGSFGHFSTLSFHATKNIQCGEGGALVINDSKFIDRAEIIREKGTNRKEFLRGNIQKYQWVDKGSSYLLAELLCAQLYGQILDYEEIQQTRLETWNYYYNTLSEIFKLRDWEILTPNASNVAHIFAVITDSEKDKKKFIDKLLNKGIQITSHYQPLHSSLAGRKLSRSLGEFLQTQKFADNMIRLPVWSHKDSKFRETVVKEISDLLTKSM
jgi:dTDP-4-amino-4,6-dideoxygalactose transaminase